MFCVYSRVWHKTPEEGQRTYQPKRRDYNNEDEINSPNILSNNNLSIHLSKSVHICDGKLGIFLYNNKRLYYKQDFNLKKQAKLQGRHKTVNLLNMARIF